MLNEEAVPAGVDITRPSVARVYDFMLGGKDNFAVDRMAAERALAITPDGPEAGRANRDFLGRVTSYLAGTGGIRQFLDIGSGLPTQRNVHEVVHETDAGIHVVYVDNDPMVLAHGRVMLADEATTTVVKADIREPKKILESPEVLRHIDFTRPVGLLLFGILHHVSDQEDPGAIAALLRDALAPGSFLAISHFRDPGPEHPDVSAKALEVERVFNETMGTGRWRRQEEILAYFGDWEVLDPGLVPVADWRPDTGERPEQTYTYLTMAGGVARKA